MSARLVADVEALREVLAHAYDPEAFEDHPIEQRRRAAAIQWAARRHVATKAADRLLTSGVVQPREDAEREALLQAADDIDRQVLAAPYSGASLGPWLRDRADRPTDGGAS